MSPACMATVYEGDNGGATSTGVTSTEIRVAAMTSSSNPPATDPFVKVMNALVEYFNTRYELYGRRLVPVFAGGSARSALDARALAANTVAQAPFGTITGRLDWSQPQAALVTELARRGVVTVVGNTGAWWTDRTLFDPLHPYVWSVYPSAEDLQLNLGTFACTSLAGHPAAHTVDPALQGPTRHFGLVNLGQEVPPPSGVVRDTLAACTGRTPPRAEWRSGVDVATLKAGLARLQEEGVTTIICACESYVGQLAMFTAAHQLGFYPEWIIPPNEGFGGGDIGDEANVQYYRQSATLSPPMRLSAGPRLLPYQATPWFQALMTTGATIGADAPTAYSMRAYARFVYEQLLVLVSGIQSAGPQLTPETFAAGLLSAQFPNPGVGSPPLWQPSAGFGPGDHSFYDDYSVAWWSETADAVGYPSPSSSPKGSWCYLGQGSRFRPGTYPAAAEQLLFNSDLPCR